MACMLGEENLLLMADLHHLGRREGRQRAELLERFDLVEAARKPAATYSGGMRRRLDLVSVLLGEAAERSLTAPMLEPACPGPGAGFDRRSW